MTQLNAQSIVDGGEAMPRPADLAILRVLVVGQLRADELRWALAPLAGTVEAEFTCDCAAAETILAESWEGCDLVVLAQVRPGELAASEVERLRRLAPLASFVALLGPWCEGEARSGRPWPGVERCYWHQWPARAASELARAAAGRASTWMLPVTATEEERVLVASRRSSPSNGELGAAPGAVHVVSDEKESRDYLADACREFGYTTTASAWDMIPDALDTVHFLADFTELNATAIARLQSIRHAHPSSRIVAIIGFPRPHDMRRAIDARANSVLSKPLRLADLWACLDAAAKARPSSARASV